jgi:hypothetical protein
VSWIAKLKEARKKAQKPTDPWHLHLEGLRGKIWDDGIEPISTQTVFDALGGRIAPARPAHAGG